MPDNTKKPAIRFSGFYDSWKYLKLVAFVLVEETLSLRKISAIIQAIFQSIHRVRRIMVKWGAMAHICLIKN